MNYLDSLIRLETLKARLRTYGESPEEVEALMIIFQNKASTSKYGFFDVADIYIYALCRGEVDLLNFIDELR